MTNLTLDLTQSNFGIHEHVAYPKLIPDIWLLSLAVLVRDEWRMRNRDDRGSRYP